MVAAGNIALVQALRSCMTGEGATGKPGDLASLLMKFKIVDACMRHFGKEGIKEGILLKRNKDEWGKRQTGAMDTLLKKLGNWKALISARTVAANAELTFNESAMDVDTDFERRLASFSEFQTRAKLSSTLHKTVSNMALLVYSTMRLFEQGIRASEGQGASNEPQGVLNSGWMKGLALCTLWTPIMAFLATSIGNTRGTYTNTIEVSNRPRVYRNDCC